MSLGASSSLLSKNIKIEIYRTVILPFVLYGCGTRSLREECMLQVFENRLLKRIFGPKRDKVRREWRKLHSVEFDELYCSPNIILVKSRKFRWVGHVACMGERSGAYSVLVGKPGGKRPLGEDPGIDGRIILRWIFK